LKHFGISTKDNLENGRKELKILIKYYYPGVEIVDNGDSISFNPLENANENMVNFN